jgi:hypothetical protein
MVGSWPCKVSSEIHINGQHVSEPVHEDKGKTTATESEDEKDPKRACVVLSKGGEVVGPVYSRLTGAAAMVPDRGENSGNPSRANRVSKTEQHYPSQVSRVRQVSQDNSTDRRADRVSRVGNIEQKIGGYNWVANTESRVMENSANTENWVTQNSANTESRVMENSANTESRVTENSANMENWVTLNSDNMESQVTEKSANTENWVIQDSRGGGVVNRKKEKVLLQAKC